MGQSLFDKKTFTVLVSLLTVIILLFGVIIVLQLTRGNGSDPVVASVASPSPDDEAPESSPAPSRTLKRSSATPKPSPIRSRTQMPQTDSEFPAAEMPSEQQDFDAPAAAEATPLPLPPAQPNPVIEEPEIVCPSGHLSVSLDEARLGPADDYLGRRPVVIVAPFAMMPLLL